MKYIFRIILLLSVTLPQLGCVAYKVSLNDSAYSYRSQDNLIVTEKYEGIPHCGFAQITVVTAGIIPSGCERVYVATSSQAPEATEIGTVSYLQGWITLLLTPFPSWSYQGRESVEEEIVNKISVGEP